MSDRISPSHRSWNMSRIRGENTKPEIRVRSLFHRMGYRFRLRRRHPPGKPDLILPRHKAAVFVHGCFWHRHRSCRYAYTPKSNVAFWRTKFQKNVKRDLQVSRLLTSLGWKVIIIWECETMDLDTLKPKVLQLMTQPSSRTNG
jgi:DNA mismatch endonuclease (patch repair protein)